MDRLVSPTDRVVSKRRDRKDANRGDFTIDFLQVTVTRAERRGSVVGEPATGFFG